MAVEPLHDAPAAVVDLDGDRSLVVADYHAGIEVSFRREGIEVPSQAADRRSSLLDLLDRADAERLVVLGDLGHTIGESGRLERDELFDLFAALPRDLPVTLVKGNHDGDVEVLLEDVDHPVEVTPSHGARVGDVGLAHGHTWPSPAVLEAGTVVVGHEHPVVRLEDEVGGHRMERVWLRGALDPEPFERFHDADLAIDGELVFCPAFNELSGGTWINVPERDFLAPFLPAGLADGEAYLLDGTRLGPFRDV